MHSYNHHRDESAPLLIELKHLNYLLQGHFVSSNQYQMFETISNNDMIQLFIVYFCVDMLIILVIVK